MKKGFGRALCVAVCLLLICHSIGLAEPEAALPSPNQVSGWTRSEQAKVYYPDTLFEYINGAAETYLDYGFVELAACEYRNPQMKGCSAVVDIYDMGAVNNAFGIYANGLYPDLPFVKIGAQGYVSENKIHFWKDQYYVEITGYGDPEKMQELIRQLANAVSANIKAEAKLPEGAKLFPSDGLVPNTLKYMRQNGLGQSFILNAFLADYKRGDAEVQLLIAEYPSDKEAQVALDKFKAFVTKMGKVKSEDECGFIGADPYYETVVARNARRFLLCTLRSSNVDKANTLLAETIRLLPE